MSLQEIEHSRVVSGSTQGLDREIDASSMKMMFDVLQINQYAKPIDSVVREIASNAADSQIEKEIAIKILTGKAKPEDFFVERKGIQFDASKFDPTYYDLKYLDQTKNTVNLYYIEGEGTGFTDNFVVEDNGVGIGRERLRGYFKLGFSTKRTTSHALGAYGLGAKSPLATHVPYYTLETAYNGKYFKFQCYTYKVESVVPRFNLEAGIENPSILLNPEAPENKQVLAYYEETDLKNFTRITTGAKRTSREKYKNAVKRQLLYFKDIHLWWKREGEDHYDEIPFRAKILHNSKNLLISDTSQFSRPHVIIVKEVGSPIGVSYGAVDFQELEMHQLHGAVGFKCPVRSVIENPETGERKVIQEGVTTSPSRETIVWDEHTRNYIQKVVDSAQEEASVLVAKELDEKDFWKWIDQANAVISGFSSYNKTALGILSNLVERKDIKPVYITEDSEKIKYYATPEIMLSGVQLKKIVKKTDKYNSKTNQYTYKFERDEISTWSGFNPACMYLIEPDTRHSPIKDSYLSELHNNCLYTIRFLTEDEIIRNVRIDRPKASLDTVYSERDRILKKQATLKKLIMEHPEFSPKSYRDVVVPEVYEKQIEEAEVEVVLTPKEKRERQGKIVVMTYVGDDRDYTHQNYKSQKLEPKIEQLDNVNQQIIYGVQEDEGLLKRLITLHRSRVSYYSPLFSMKYFAEDPPVDNNFPLILKFSKRNLKYIKNNPNYINVKDYFHTISKTAKTFELGSFFIPYQTGKYIHENLTKVAFLCNFKEFNLPLFEAYEYLEKYANDNYSKYDNSAFFEGNYSEEGRKFDEMARQAVTHHLWCIENPEATELEINTEAKNIYGEHLGKNILSTKAIDEEVVSLLLSVLDYGEPLAPLFNSVNFLTKSCANVPSEAVRYINDVIETAGRSTWELPNYTTNNQTN